MDKIKLSFYLITLEYMLFQLSKDNYSGKKEYLVEQILALQDDIKLELNSI